MKKGYIEPVALADIAEEYADNPELSKSKGCRLLKPYDGKKGSGVSSGAVMGEDGEGLEDEEEGDLGECVCVCVTHYTIWIAHCRAGSKLHSIVHNDMQMSCTTQYGLHTTRMLKEQHLTMWFILLTFMYSPSVHLISRND